VQEWQEHRLGRGTFLIGIAFWIIVLATLVAMWRPAADPWKDVDIAGLLFAEVRRVALLDTAPDAEWLKGASTRLEHLEAHLGRGERLAQECRRRLGIRSRDWNWRHPPKLGFLQWQPDDGKRPRIRVRDLMWITARTPRLLAGLIVWILFVAAIALVVEDDGRAWQSWVDTGLRLALLASWVVTLTLVTARAFLILHARLACERDNALKRIKGWLADLSDAAERQTASDISLRVGRFTVSVRNHHQE
jgi:hypothetical protein